jgi:HME family heavy-metal exporter
MTALSAGVALIPLMIGADSPGKEILSPVAITIFGGLISSTLLDTFLTPVLFLRYGRASLERLVQAAKADDPEKTAPSGAAVQTY